MNVTTVPITNGTYAKTFSTAGLPPATYYVFVQYSGGDNTFNITTKGFAGQVVNTKTNETIFNFTGTGNVQDESAMLALGNALNTQGFDDVYTKLGIVLAAPAINTTTIVTTPVSSTSVPKTTTKAPLPAIVVLAGIGMAALFVAKTKRR